MIESFIPWYAWFKAFHVISVIAWMSGLFYLPRLFVYHCQVKAGSSESARFKIMERRLLKAITTPAMISSFVFGTFLVMTPGVITWSSGWWHVKMAALTGMFIFHGFCSHWAALFAEDRNMNSEKYYRIANEIPTLLMLVIVVMVIVKPF